MIILGSLKGVRSLDDETLKIIEELTSTGSFILCLGRMNGEDIDIFWKTSDFPTDKFKQFIVEFSKQLKTHKEALETASVSTGNTE